MNTRQSSYTRTHARTHTYNRWWLALKSWLGEHQWRPSKPIYRLHVEFMARYIDTNIIIIITPSRNVDSTSSQAHLEIRNPSNIDTISTTFISSHNFEDRRRVASLPNTWNSCETQLKLTRLKLKACNGTAILVVKVICHRLHPCVVRVPRVIDVTTVNLTSHKKVILSLFYNPFIISWKLVYRT